MRLSFFSNYLNEHQLPLCCALAARDDLDFTFVALSEHGGNVGRSNLNTVYPFVLREYEGEAYAGEALKHAERDDIVVFGHMGGREQYVERRIGLGLPSFRASERILKRGLWWRFMPAKALNTYRMFTRYKEKPLYLLCAGAYASYDLSLSGWPVEKCFKWGYFPETRTSNSRSRAIAAPAALVWAGRLISWKRPLAPLRLAKKLKRAGYSFVLHMAGDGPMMQSVLNYVSANQLDDVVELYGMLGGEELGALMRNADICLATSSRKEGWGTVVNEAMAAGCAVVVSASLGCAPFLVQDGVNGLLYDDLSEDDLFRKVAQLLDSPSLVGGLSDSAVRSIEGEWCADEAASRLVDLGASILTGKPCVFQSGPCSCAQIIKDGWYRQMALRSGRGE